MEENKERVKFKAVVSKIFSPKYEEDRTNDVWYSLSAKVTEDIEGKTKPDYRWGTVRITGNMPTMVLGEEYEFTCYENVDPKYGLQYKVAFVKRSDIILQDDANGKDFLRRIMTENQFKALYDLTDTPIKYLEEGDIDFLAQGKGLGKASAEKLIKKYENNKGKANEYIELAPYDLTDSEIERIVKAYGDVLAAKNAIERDVYSLIKTVDGIGFKKADDIAMRMGMDKNDPRRIKAYIVYLLETVANDEGSTWVWLDNLIDQCVNVLEFPYHTEEEMDATDDKIIQCIKEMLDQDIIWSDTRHEKVALMEYRMLERNIAKELIRIKYGESTLTSSDIDGKLKELGDRQGWFLNEQQVEGAKAVVNESLVVSIGKAGTGKSSSINGGVESFDTSPSLSQCALSGKCADNLKNVTGREASTIHRLLGFNPMTSGFCHDKDYKLFGEMFILDEVGMCNLRILYSLLQAIPSGAKFVMLGDTAQLPPIGVGNFLQDVIRSGVITVNELTKVNRQAEGSRIKTLSFDIADGKQFYKKGEEFEREEGDLKTVIYRDKTLIPERVVREFFKMKQDMNAQIEDLAIICSTREKGALSCLALNREVQNRLINKQARGDKYAVKNENRENEIRFYEGDRILNEKNNYKVPIYSPQPDGSIMELDENGEVVVAPLFNGQVGTITKVIRGAKRKQDLLVVEFDSSYEPLIIDMEQLNKCSLGYALTVFKCQGMTIPYTVCAFDYSAYKMLSKELVYTALTRAKEKAVIVAESDALRYAISRSAIVNVNTFLKDFLIEEDNKVKNGEIVFETKNEVRAIVPPPRLSDDDITYPCELEDCEDMEGEDFAKDYELSLDDLILGQNDIFDK